MNGSEKNLLTALYTGLVAVGHAAALPEDDVAADLGNLKSDRSYFRNLLLATILATAPSCIQIDRSQAPGDSDVIAVTDATNPDTYDDGVAAEDTVESVDNFEVLDTISDLDIAVDNETEEVADIISDLDIVVDIDIDSLDVNEVIEVTDSGQDALETTDADIVEIDVEDPKDTIVEDIEITGDSEVTEHVEVNMDAADSSDQAETDLEPVCGVCGDDVCNEWETIYNCPSDCPTTVKFCNDQCADGDNDCFVTCGCGDAYCNAVKGETIDNCPEDCTFEDSICGEGSGGCTYAAGESPHTCSDCNTGTFCGVQGCGYLENCMNCSQDCGSCLSGTTEVCE